MGVTDKKATVKGLDPTVSYSYQVTAVNVGGVSPPVSIRLPRGRMHCLRLGLGYYPVLRLKLLVGAGRPRLIPLMFVLPLFRLGEFRPLLALALLGSACQQSRAAEASAASIANWQLGPFVRDDGADILGPNPASTFHCPIQKQDVPWEDKQVLCATAAVKDGKVYLLYRAENRGRPGEDKSDRSGHQRGWPPLQAPGHPGAVSGRGRIQSSSGPGDGRTPGCAVSEDGTYVMTYTAYDGKRPRLFVATSTDFVHWQKHGSAFGRCASGKYADLRSKSGAIICRQQGEKFVAARVNGKYWMYFGEYGATIGDVGQPAGLGSCRRKRRQAADGAAEARGLLRQLRHGARAFRAADAARHPVDLQRRVTRTE